MKNVSCFFFFFLGWLQYRRQTEVRSKTDDTLYLYLAREDLLQQDNETNC